MTHAIDFVLNVVKKISSKEPVLFQRDGSLYVASADGFGKVGYGLRTAPEEIQPWEERRQSPEIVESQDAIKKWVGDSWYKKPKFLNGEQKYFKSIVFGSDSNSFSLEEITKIAQELAKLPDDGKIRMVLHGSNYHSHKYGYAADGIDVFIQQARVMGRDRYLELMRKKENKILQDMESLAETKDNVNDRYQRLTFPDCVILTPYMFVSLPRRGRLDFHRHELDAWKQDTTLKISYSGSSTYDESPFAMHITLNAQYLKIKDAEKLIMTKDKVLEHISKELSAVKSNMELAEKFIARINEVHNKVSAKDIKWKKNLRNRERVD